MPGWGGQPHATPGWGATSYMPYYSHMYPPHLAAHVPLPVPTDSPTAAAVVPQTSQPPPADFYDSKHQKKSAKETQLEDALENMAFELVKMRSKLDDSRDEVKRLGGEHRQSLHIAETKLAETKFSCQVAEARLAAQRIRATRANAESEVKTTQRAPIDEEQWDRQVALEAHIDLFLRLYNKNGASKKLWVRRGHAVEDLTNRLGSTPGPFLKLTNVGFKDDFGNKEDGVDADGLTKDLFTSYWKEIFEKTREGQDMGSDTKLGLFRSASNSRDVFVPSDHDNDRCNCDCEFFHVSCTLHSRIVSIPLSSHSPFLVLLTPNPATSCGGRASLISQPTTLTSTTLCLFPCPRPRNRSVGCC